MIMKFLLFIFLSLFLSCESRNIPIDLNNNEKDNNIKMKVIGEPNIKKRK